MTTKHRDGKTVLSCDRPDGPYQGVDERTVLPSRCFMFILHALCFENPIENEYENYLFAFFYFYIFFLLFVHMKHPGARRVYT